MFIRMTEAEYPVPTASIESNRPFRKGLSRWLGAVKTLRQVGQEVGRDGSINLRPEGQDVGGIVDQIGMQPETTRHGRFAAVSQGQAENDRLRRELG